LDGSDEIEVTVAHVISLVEVGFVPKQPPLPVTVKVAVKLPDEIVGVKVARAGFAFCDQFPEPAPPDQLLLLYVPPSLAPVIVIAAIPVQTLISEPAVAVGAISTVITMLLGALVPQPFVAVTLSVPPEADTPKSRLIEFVEPLIVTPDPL
jgi:hypothetical protein